MEGVVSDAPLEFSPVAPPYDNLCYASPRGRTHASMPAKPSTSERKYSI